MAQQPGNPMPFIPHPPRTPGRLAEMIATCVKNLVKIAFWLVVALVTAAAVFLAFRAVIFGCRMVLHALGV